MRPKELVLLRPKALSCGYWVLRIGQDTRNSLREEMTPQRRGKTMGACMVKPGGRREGKHRSVFHPIIACSFPSSLVPPERRGFRSPPTACVAIARDRSA